MCVSISPSGIQGRASSKPHGVGWAAVRWLKMQIPGLRPGPSGPSSLETELGTFPSKQSPSPQHPLWAPGASVPALAFQSLQLQASVLVFGVERQPVSYRRGLEPQGCDPLPVKRLCRKAPRCSRVSGTEGTTVQGLTKRSSIFPGSVPGSVLHGPRASGWTALFVLQRARDGCAD